MTVQPTDYMSKTFSFVNLNPVHPMLAQIGIKRVCSVILHESEEFQLGLSSVDSNDPDDIEYYRFSELEIENP